MVKRVCWFLFFPWAMALSPGVVAVSDSQYAAIRALGRLNGVALHCGYLEQTRQMKQALVENLPKRRELGMTFDQLTNESYLNFMQSGNGCPEPDGFARQVDEAVFKLDEVF